MKRKIELIIGFVAAVVSMIGILWIFVACLYQHLFTDYAPHGPYMVLPLGLILPSMYCVGLIRKKRKHVFMVCLVWCISWLASYVVDYVTLYTESLDHPRSALIEIVIVFLSVIVDLPTHAYLNGFIDTFSVNEYTAAMRAINGVIFFILLWIGFKGLKRNKIEKIVDKSCECR